MSFSEEIKESISGVKLIRQGASHVAPAFAACVKQMTTETRKNVPVKCISFKFPMAPLDHGHHTEVSLLCNGTN